MEVSLDRAACQGDCICELICAEVFALDDNGIAYVHQRDDLRINESNEWVTVSSELASRVTQAARDCPTHAIFLRDDPEE